jgi:uncharacterized protein
MNYCKLFYNNKDYIAYRKLVGKKGSIVFFGGFASNMNGTKATAIYQFCKENNIALVLFDYLGHGDSSGNFIDYTVSGWLENCIKVIDELTDGKQIIIGSSMGGWLMMLTALQSPKKVSALIGISSAPDFTEDLIFKQLSHKQREELDFYGIINFFSSEKGDNCAYKITKNLIIDGRKNLLLTEENIQIECPIRLLHSMGDKDVPYYTSLKIAEKVRSNDVKVHLIKSAGHNMSDRCSLKVLFDTIEEFLFAEKI